MAGIQEVCDDGSAADRPRTDVVNLDQCGGHHMVVLQLPKYILTRLHVVMWHTEDVTCRRAKIWSTIVLALFEMLGVTNIYNYA